MKKPGRKPGHSVSKETRKKIGDATRSQWKQGIRKGHKVTAEHKEKLRTLRLGVKCSKETKKKMSESHKTRVMEGKFRNQFGGYKGGYSNTLWKNRQRQVIKVANGGSHTLEQWLAMKEWNAHLCADCGNMEPFIKLTQDHIIPVSKGGTNNIDNLQPLCLSCNSRKHDKVISFINC